MSANERQVAGSHYSAPVQHWDYAIRVLNNRYLEGNITKYVTRHRKKNGMQDLDKAAHYTQKLIEEYEANRVDCHIETDLSFDIHAFIVGNGLNTLEAYVVKRLAHWTNVSHLYAVANAISLLKRDQADNDRRMEALKAGAGPSYVDQDR